MRESSLVVRGRAILVIGGECVEICNELLLYSSHYMYLGFVTTLHTLYSFDIYMMMMYAFHLYLVGINSLKFYCMILCMTLCMT